MRERFAKAASGLRRNLASDESGSYGRPPTSAPLSFSPPEHLAPSALRLEGSAGSSGAADHQPATHLAGQGTPPPHLGGDGDADAPHDYDLVDLERRRDQLQARVAELQWDLGGLVYEMATRDRIRVDILVKRAAVLQDADAELAEVERILRMDQTATAGACSTCGAPHSSGAAFCWQCGNAILRQVDTSSIMAP